MNAFSLDMALPFTSDMPVQTYALIQHGTRLYLVDAQQLSADMFYQQALRRFGQFHRIRLEPHLPVAELALAALEAQEALGKWADSEEGGTKEQVAGLLAQLLQQKAGMLGEYWGIEVDGGEWGMPGRCPEVAAPV